MEILTEIIQTTLNSFDFAYCIVVNVLTYITINIANDKHKELSIWNKRLILCIIILAIGLIYYLTGSDVKRILNSAILAPVFWSWILKPICKKFKVDYKQINIFD